MLDASTCKECPSTNKPSAGIWSPMFKKTISPTTMSNIEISCRRPYLKTSMLILSLILERLSNCISCLKLLKAETTTTRKTAMKMLPPSYQPSLGPSSLMPKPSARAAQTSRIIMVVSLKASSTKNRSPFGGGL
uniref:Uncharacterized protein n=1 Tax=Rhizophora mucronata TaxID=61149 RepID=A0A2P2NKN5_RHIMU